MSLRDALWKFDVVLYLGILVFLLFVLCLFIFFLFKQKTAYEFSLGLVGSEKGIRDSTGAAQMDGAILVESAADGPMPQTREPVSYTHLTLPTTLRVYISRGAAA